MRQAILSLLLLPVLLCGKIIETRYFSDIIPHIDEETWLVVDIDHTIFEVATALGSSEWFDALMKKKRQSGLSEMQATNEVREAYYKIINLVPVKPMEKITIPTLIDLQNKKIVVMALTFREPKINEATFKQASSLGLDFKTTAPSQKMFSFKLKSPVLYENGILFANNFSKGTTFLAFLKQIGKRPKKVVFVDDVKSNVESMNTSLESVGIDIVSVYYTAKNFAPTVYSPEIANFQEIFLNKVMSNEAALLLMKNHLE